MRNILAYVVFFVVFTAQAAFAGVGTDQARDFIQGIGDKVIAIVADGKISSEVKEKQLNALFVKTVDIKWIAKFVVGRYWRDATAAQQAKYLKLYNDFLIRSYVSKFRQYTDQKMTIKNFFMEDEDEYAVETTIDDQDGKSYAITYKVKKSSDGSMKIYDIVAEGISMITTQRSDFGSILAREGMDALLKKLEQKS